MNAYNPEANYGPAFFDARHNFVLSANYEIPFGRRTRAATSRRCSTRPWRLEPERHLPGANRVPDHRDRRTAPSLQGTRGNERPNCVGDPVPADQNISHWLDIYAFSRAARGTLGNCGIGVARAPGYQNIDAVFAKQFSVGGPRDFEFRAEAFNLTNTPSFSPPARDINSPNTFGTIRTR